MEQQLFLVSIDTEAPVGNNAVDNMIYCNTNEGEYGINYIMDLLDKYRVKGLFFVDIAEAWHYGKNKIEKVLLDIDKRGHDIGVHIHPDHMADINRKFLWEYSFDEQYEIIKKCTVFYQEVLNRTPLSFRAGRYGADNNTIRILSELGYKFDMSMYYGMKKRCKIEGKYETINSVKFLKNGLYEIPVTVFKSFDFFGYRRFDKLDESMPFGEFKALVNEIIRCDCVSVGSFFMHSFSFIEWRNNPDNPTFNKKNNSRINNMFKHIYTNQHCKFISEKDLLELIDGFELKNKENTIIDMFSLKYSFTRAYKIVKEKMIRDI